jgi:glycosyltransferase involved in cell wall biosynthesis
VANQSDRLRVALVAGCLSQGGAEKQLFYMVRALRQAGIELRVYCLTRGEFYESALRSLGVEPIWVGRHPNPFVRLATLATGLRSFRPHVVQASHFFANFYLAAATLVGRVLTIGAIRNDTYHEVAANRPWGRSLLRIPHVLLANSIAGKRNALQFGVNPERIYVVGNVIDLADFDQRSSLSSKTHFTPGSPIVVARLVPDKRLDRFLAALAIARRGLPHLQGVIVGDGSERASLELAASLHGLVPDGVRFLGSCDDVPALLRNAGMLVLCSDREGFPNVLLEAMAARLPIITMPAGDAGILVQNEVTGYVIPLGDLESLAERMVCLARSPELRDKLGHAGRRVLEQSYSCVGLADRLLTVYRMAAERCEHRRVLDLLPYP